MRGLAKPMGLLALVCVALVVVHPLRVGAVRQDEAKRIAAQRRRDEMLKAVKPAQPEASVSKQVDEETDDDADLHTFEAIKRYDPCTGGLPGPVRSDLDARQDASEPQRPVHPQ